MKIMLQKQFDTLRPVGEIDREAIRSLRNGGMFMAEIKRTRNPRHHRKLFALLNIVLQNQEHYKSTDHLLGACKLATGHVDMVRTKRGDVAIPKSIAFHAMGQDEFEKFYDAAIDWVISDVIPGLSRADLDAEVAAEIQAFAA